MELLGNIVSWLKPTKIRQIFKNFYHIIQGQTAPWSLQNFSLNGNVIQKKDGKIEKKERENKVINGCSGNIILRKSWNLITYLHFVVDLKIRFWK